MATDLDSNNAQALLQSTQELRMHWSGLTTNIMYFTIVALVAVWTLFIQAYIGDFVREKVWNHAHLAFASTISIVLLVLWRWYTKYLDDNTAHLYPELVYFEGILSCPSKYGTVGYLKRNLGKKAGDRLQEVGDIEQRAEVVTELVKKNLIGGRGHNRINWITLGVIVILGLIVFGLGICGFLHIGGGAIEQGLLRSELKWLCGVLSILGIFGMVILLVKWQRNPREIQIKEIIRQVTGREGDKAKD